MPEPTASGAQPAGTQPAGSQAPHASTTADRQHAAAARLIGAALRPDLQTLLRTDDPELLAARLTRLDLSRSRDEDAERLDRLVADMVARRRTLVETLARALIALLTALVVAGVALVAASFAASAFRSWFSVRWLEWPPNPRLVTVVAGLLVLAWVVGYAVVFLRSWDRLARARRAVRLAAVHRPETWPGLALDAPFAQLARRLSYPGWSLVAAACLLFAGAGVTHRLGVLVVVLVVVWLALGAWLVMLARPYRHAQDLAERTLFAGRPD